jgi:hypothetical protein
LPTLERSFCARSSSSLSSTVLVVSHRS